MNILFFQVGVSESTWGFWKNALNFNIFWGIHKIKDGQKKVEKQRTCSKNFNFQSSLTNSASKTMQTYWKRLPRSSSMTLWSAPVTKRGKSNLKPEELWLFIINCICFTVEKVKPLRTNCLWYFLNFHVEYVIKI